MTATRWPLKIALVLLAGCSPSTSKPPPPAVTPATHTFFPISTGAVHEFGKTLLPADGAIACESCHAVNAESFTDFSCTGCHAHSGALTDRLHAQTADYAFDSKACISCHPASDKKPFDHAGITDQCAQCHDVATVFAALPKPNFTHPSMNASDCSSCHQSFTTWVTTNGAQDKSNPANDLTVVAQTPTWTGTDISLFTPLTEVLPMPMVHGTPDLDAATLGTCSNCHLGAAQGAFFPGWLHSSLANLTVGQPTKCGSCHVTSMPTGFIGPLATSPARTPPSPEMKHDAVAWANGGPTSLALVPTDCGVCHAPPAQTAIATGWVTGRSGSGPVQYHASLASAGQSQPGSCIDCHANTRPSTVLNSGNSSLPTALQFDHGALNAQGDCTGCHAKSATAPFTSWGQAVFHTTGSSTPSTCLPCHTAERPTATTGWVSTTYTKSPFDYGTNAQGVTHGAGLDCVTCHANPGTGQWGSTHNWAAGSFTHGPSTLSGTACITCHSTQRPDLVLGVSQANTALGFDHSLNGSGDCFGCHQATVTAATYVNYFNPQNGRLPNGDWKNGVQYPGSSYASSTTQSITVNETKLNRSGANNLVTSMTTTSATIYNGMLHTSTQVPAVLSPGPNGSNTGVCWHCHTSTGTTVTSFNDGQYHTALTNYRATPGGTVAPIAQPTTGCADCHQPGLPLDIVQKGGAALFPMDHSAQFAAAVTLGGKSVTAVSQADCSVCHKAPGNTWTDGVFHANISSAQPKECVSCHYPLMADGTKSDLTRGLNAMKHRSALLTTQSCEKCHTAALTKATTTPTASPLWAVGALHANLTPQPTACVDCHAAALPTTSTQSTVTWTFSLASGTATNGAMWMNHASANAVGKDCVVCHAADAKATGSAWSKSDSFHTPVPTVTACNACHGPTNGNGTVAGTKNNLPNGLSNSSTTTTASASTGVAGQLDLLTHTDINVSNKDCIVCHVVPATGPWTQEKFHANLTASNPIIPNGTTGRCSNCHLNVKPGPGYAQQDHSTFTGTSARDCSSCHSYPGTGTAGTANWLGAMGPPTLIAVGAFPVPTPPAPTGTMQAGIMSLPHPTVGTQSCLACHADSGGGKNATGYDHASALISTNCAACHEAGSNLVGTTWNGATTTANGAGDTRPFTLTSLVANHGSGLTVTYPNHFYPADCSQCHVLPAGNGSVTTGTAYAQAWSFPHNQAAMSNPTTCLMCHTNGIPGAPDGGVADPNTNVTLTAQVPRFSGTTIASVSAQVETLPMSMLHSSSEFPAAANSACSNCHATASSGFYYPGDLHSSLANLKLAEPTACASCHANAVPTGFVGPTATSPVRSPSTGEMRHEAVRWNNGAPTTTTLVGTNCGQCHASPSATLQATWATSADGGLVKYHASIGAQPSSCLDCHANSRPTALLTSGNAALPTNVQFDHTTATALGDCQTCHTKSTVSPWSSWSGGQFHLTGAANPTTCLPCHSGERPTSTTGWASTTYTQAPFDYGTNAQGITHGDGLDCATCHAGPGTGAWGSTQNWQSGHFTHGATTVSGSTCLACHASQRPDLVLGVSQANAAVGFDHAANGTGDCVGCHQATVIANTYAHYFNTGTNMLPNGDWKGGAAYPGSSLVSAPTQFVTLTEITLNRSGANNLVTSTSTTSATLYNAMLHISAALPTQLNAGPTGSPDNTKCWHCHTHPGNSTTVSSFANGQYHSSLTTYTATLGGAVTPFPQPTSRCNDCHSTMYPSNIVEKSGSDLQPMDHAAQFASAVTLGGASVTAVNQVDCSVCHKSPGTAWTDGLFHANIGAAQPKDCVTCHYPLMADAAKSDLTSATDYAMKHKSASITSQACASCHPSALGAATTASHAATLWKTGGFHANIGAQPGACVDCHQVSEPALNASTQSTVTYALALGGTTSNGAQWMNHGSTYVAGKDCIVCHASDARTSGSAWSRSDVFHPTTATSASCANCHGTSNGKGTTIGTNNNLPTGLTNSTKVSSAAGAAMTGIPAGTLAQISHADVNVTGFDCTTCHTQKGTSTTAGVQGKEWAQAAFHSHFTGATALVMNKTTGRCSNCHMNVKPGAAFPTDHSTFTATSGTDDCSKCHSYPGTGTASAPNWLGAAGVPTTILVGGFPISQPPATTATTQAGISNLPHPTATTCTSCHTSSSGSSPAIGYDHASTLIAKNCGACHEAGSTHMGTPWNNSTTIAAGAGDTRPFTATALKATFSGNTCSFTNPNHFYPVNCAECHATPTGIVNVSTGTTYTNTRWKFVHTERNMTNPSTCNLCHKTCPKG